MRIDEFGKPGVSVVVELAVATEFTRDSVGDVAATLSGEDVGKLGLGCEQPGDTVRLPPIVQVVELSDLDPPLA